MKYSAANNAFYLPEIHGTAIPDDAVDITNEEHHALLADQSNNKQIVAGPNGRPVAIDAPPPDLADQRRIAIGKMTAWIERFLSQFTVGTPATEIASWPTKAIAAAAHLAGQPQDIIRGEALLTGENPDELAAVIQQRSQLYIAIIARMTGLRRKATRNITAANTAEDVAAALDDALATAHQLLADLGLSQES